MKITHLNEMALNRSDAIDRCCNQGKQFIEHFHKGVHEGVNSNSFQHHCTEMQAFWDNVKFIVLQQNKKQISSDNLLNWFFLCGSDVEHMIEEPFQDLYETLYISLLADRKNSKVLDILSASLT